MEAFPKKNIAFILEKKKPHEFQLINLKHKSLFKIQLLIIFLVDPVPPLYRKFMFFFLHNKNNRTKRNNQLPIYTKQRRI